MTYASRFILADDLVAHLDAVIPTIPLMIRPKYVGFLSVTGVASYELATKDILISFCEKKHSVFGRYISEHCSRLNGRIKRDDLENDFVKKFGPKYLKRYKEKIKKAERKFLLSDGISVTQSYANLITWRNQYAHEGVLPTLATYDEVRKAYFFGKNIVHILANSVTK